MRHLSLFSGIGGFDLASDWMGWENVAHCEINPFCQRILKYYWPNAESFTDIKTTDFTKFNGSVDIVSGGFPCQPFSAAGKREGTNDERHLWPEMLRAIREISPAWVVGENVRGLISWNGGLVFDEVQADLETAGYEILPFLLPACAVNAPHERYRIWFIAHRTDTRSKGLQGRKNKVHGFETITNSHGQRLQEWFQSKFGGFFKPTEAQPRGEFTRNYTEGYWDKFPTQSPLCNGNDGFSSRLDGITFPEWRNESIKGGGNAVVPQIPFKIFQAIEQYKLTQ